MLLIILMKSHFRRAVLQRCSTRLFCDHVENQIVTSNCVNKLGKLLGCSPENSDFLVRKNKKLITVGTSHVSRVASFCKNHLKLKDVLEYPTILSISPEVLDDRMSTLKELGCRAVTARNLLLFHQYMQMTPSKLRWKGYRTVPESFFSQTVSRLNCPEDLKLQLRSQLLELHSSNAQLEKIKASVNATFLAWKLQCSEEVATDIMKKEPSLCTKSLDSLEKVCETLLKKLKLSTSKVLSLPKLLTINCNNIEDLLQKVPEICGIDIYDIIKKQPLILKRSVDSIYDTVRILENHGVTENQLLACTKILRCSALTISTRFEKLSVAEKYDILKTSEKFLWLVLHFKNISKIKNILEDLKMQFSLKMLLATFEANEVVKHYKKESPLGNNMTQKRDLISYLSVTFGDSTKAIKADLQRNPNFNYSSVHNAQKVVRYLTSKGITKKELRSGLDVVLYDVDLVVQYFSSLRKREDLDKSFSEWGNHPNLIQLLIYVIEKEQNFITNGGHVGTAETEILCDEEEEMLLVEDIALNAELS